MASRPVVSSSSAIDMVAMTAAVIVHADVEVAVLPHPVGALKPGHPEFADIDEDLHAVQVVRGLFTEQPVVEHGGPSISAIRSRVWRARDNAEPSRSVPCSTVCRRHPSMAAYNITFGLVVVSRSALREMRTDHSGDGGFVRVA